MKRHFLKLALVERSAYMHATVPGAANRDAMTTRALHGNGLLAKLNEADNDELLKGLEPVEMQTGQTLFDNGQYPPYVYFPLDCIISLQQVMRSGNLVEIGIVGREGLVGISSLLDSRAFCTRAAIQHAGHALRVESDKLNENFINNHQLRTLILQYMNTLLHQIAQNAACNRYHKLEQQLSRWILSMLDRLPGNELHFTQEIISNTLGVRREGVTAAATKAQAAGFIEYSRGRITVLDRCGLERRCCECYAKIKKTHEKILQ